MKIGFKYFALLSALASLWICAGADAAEVRAWLDRNSMQMGETVTLNVEVTGDNGAAKPDFGTLAQDFNLLGSQSSTSMNIVNGQASSKLLWAIGLEPKHAGTLMIPALDIAGQHTQPLTLNVQAAIAGTGGKAGDDVYLDVSVEPRAPYVQQQVHLTVKLYFALNLTDGSLDDPQADGLVVKKLGQDANYAADVGGRRYRVLERRYALLPEKSGAIALPVIAFRGHAVDPSDVNSFFSRGRSIAARADAITLDVRPRPAASGNDAWLPAHSVTLSADGIDATKTTRVGEPLTLNLHLKAQGLGFEQLPELALPKIDGADVYPDKTTTQNRDDGEWLYGERERKFALVPNRAGPLSLPAISIGWWDTAHDRAETAEVPALTLNVESAAGVAAGPDASNAANAANAASRQNPVASAAAVGATSVFADQGAEANLWRRLAFFALALWALTLTAWIVWLVRQRRRTQVEIPAHAVADTAATARTAFRAACTNKDLSAAARTLLAWARSIDSQVRNLGDLSRRVSDKTQVTAITELDRALYGAGKVDGLGARLAAAFRNGPDLSQSVAPTSLPPLPPLYPFRT
jgi:BatD DUF11 like domain